MQLLRTDKSIYKIRRRPYGDAAFPLKVRPLDDELLSSWLVRVALEHKTRPTTFTNLYLPETRNKLWAADVDLHADEELLVRLSVKAALPVEMLRSMTFRAYEGVLFERLYPATGGTPFVLRLAMRGRWSRAPGMRWCPQCLTEDEQPYFRKKWRVAIFTLCRKHRRRLVDRCACGRPLTLYKAKWDEGKPYCSKCGACLANVGHFRQKEDLESVINGQEQLQGIMGDGYVMMAGVPVYAHLYFAVLHQVMKLMLSKRYGALLREAIPVGDNQKIVFEIKRFQPLETLEIERQELLLQKGVWLLGKWPDRFIRICRTHDLFTSALLRDMKQAPFWYWRLIIDALYYPGLIGTEGEI